MAAENLILVEYLWELPRCSLVFLFKGLLLITAALQSLVYWWNQEHLGRELLHLLVSHLLWLFDLLTFPLFVKLLGSGGQ